VYELARLGPFRSIPGGDPHAHRYLPQRGKGDVHFGRPVMLILPDCPHHAGQGG
jgi:hypothetical protein